MSRLTRGASKSCVERLEHFVYSNRIDVIREKLTELNCNPLGKEDTVRDRLLRYNKRVLGLSNVDWDQIIDLKVSETEIENIVKSYDPQKVVTELEHFKLNQVGSVVIFKNRLVRFHQKSRGFPTRWSTADLTQTKATDRRQVCENSAAEKSSMSGGKNEKNYTSKRQRKLSKSNSLSRNKMSLSDENMKEKIPEEHESQDEGKNGEQDLVTQKTDSNENINPTREKTTPLIDLENEPNPNRPVTIRELKTLLEE